MSVIGFDDSFWCKRIYPSLATIKQDKKERAKIAVENINRNENKVFITGHR